MGMMLDHAAQAGVDPNCPEMRHFGRWLFLEARRCGAAGLGSASRDGLLRAMEVAAAGGGGLGQMRVYRVAAAVFGWGRLGRWSCRADRALRPGGGGDTLPLST
jgi:hypothetical protein